MAAKVLSEAAAGEKYTVHKVTGSKEQIASLAHFGILRGCDVFISEKWADGRMKIATGCKELTLTPEESACIRLEELFIRKKEDPIFFGGCCAYGNSAGIWDRIIAQDKEDAEG